VACTGSPSETPTAGGAASSQVAGSESSAAITAPSGDPIKIGVLGPNSGSFADAGLNFYQGATVAANQINAAGGILGRPVVVEQKDTADGPQASTQAVRDFASAGTTFLLGEVSSANCLADAPLVDQLNVLFITGICSVPELTGAKGAAAPYTNFFRTGATSDTMVYGLAKVMGSKFPDVSVHDAFAFDYVTGHAQWEQYKEVYAEVGKEVVADKELWVPMDQQNYASQISVLAQATTDATSNKGLYLGLYGSGVASFLQQAAPYDFLKNYAFVVIPGEYYSIARDMGGSAPEIWNSYEYNWAGYDTPENDAFVADFEALAGKKPISWSYVSYMAVLAYAAAIDKAGSVDVEAVQEALEGISFSSPQGQYTIDAGHNGTSNMTVTYSVGDPTDPEKVKNLEVTVVEAAETPTFNY
jgi:branched-chain amino acid transport system substrate-binding protein